MQKIPDKFQVFPLIWFAVSDRLREHGWWKTFQNFIFLPQLYRCGFVLACTTGDKDACVKSTFLDIWHCKGRTIMFKLGYWSLFCQLSLAPKNMRDQFSFFVILLKFKFRSTMKSEISLLFSVWFLLTHFREAEWSCTKIHWPTERFLAPASCRSQILLFAQYLI